MDERFHIILVRDKKGRVFIYNNPVSMGTFLTKSETEAIATAKNMEQRLYPDYKYIPMYLTEVGK